VAAGGTVTGTASAASGAASFGCLAGCIDQGYLRMPRSDAWRS